MGEKLGGRPNDEACYVKVVVALFCVEREPEACHRSIVGNRLAHDLGIPLEHIKP